MGSAADIARFMTKVDRSGPPHPKMGTPCWLWRGRPNAEGYAQFYTGGKTYRAHRWIFEQINGPVSAALHCDHLCRVRHCTNPDHVEPVTPRENLMRGETLAAFRASRTHCPSGHPLSGPNLYEKRQKNGCAHRQCKTCMAAHRNKPESRLREVARKRIARQAETAKQIIDFAEQMKRDIASRQAVSQ